MLKFIKRKLKEGKVLSTEERKIVSSGERDIINNTSKCLPLSSHVHVESKAFKGKVLAADVRRHYVTLTKTSPFVQK